MTGAGTEPAATDEGRQYERTVLAYWRTVLAATVAAALIVRQAGSGAERTVAIVVAALGLSAVAAVSLRREARLASRPSTVSPGPAGTVLMGLLVLQALAVVVVL